MNFDNLFVVFVNGAQDLHQSLQTALSSLFKPNVQAQYYQIEAEGLQLSPSFGQVSAPSLLNLCPQTSLFLNLHNLHHSTPTQNLAIARLCLYIEWLLNF